MSEDIASLGISIDSTQIKTASKDLDALSAASEKADVSAKKLTATSDLVKRQFDAMNQSQKDTATGTQILSQEVQRIMDRYDPLGTKLRQVTSDMALLRKEMGDSTTAGAIRAFQGLENEITKTQSLMITAGAAGVDGFEKTAQAAGKSAFSTAGARRELIVLGHEAMTGNFSRMPGSFLVLAERVRMTSALFSLFALGIASAAVGAIGMVVAFVKGSAEAANFNKALALTNDVSGLTVSKLSEMSIAISQTAGTQAKAAETLNLMAASGNIAAGNMDKLASAAIHLEQSAGISVSETVKHYEELAKDPVNASLKLTESMHYLSAETYSQIKAAEDLGDTQKAAAIAQSAYSDAIEKASSKINQNLGYLETAWHSVGSAAKSAWDFMLNIGREDSIDKKISDLQAQLITAGTEGNNTRAIYLANEITQLNNLKTATDQTASAKKAAIDIEEARIKWMREGEKYESKQVQMQHDIAQAIAEGNAAKIGQSEIDVRVAEIQAKYAGNRKVAATAEDTAYKQITKSIAEYNAQLNVELENGTKLTQGEKLQIDSKLKLSAAHQALIKSQLDSVLVKERDKAMDDDANKRMEVSLANGEKELSSLEAQVQKQLEQNAVIGLTKAQVDALEASRLDALITSKETVLAIVGENSVLEQQIAALKELQQAKFAGAARQVVADEAKKTADEWKKVTSQIETSLTDSLMRGFEGGKGGMKNFIDSLKHTLEAAALKIVIQAIVNPVTGAVQNAFTSGGAGGTSATSSLSLLSSLSSGNSSVYAGFNSFAGSSVGQSLGLTNSASFVGPVAPGGTAGLGLTSLGQDLQTALPYLPAVAALVQGNYVQAGLAAVGAYFGGPIGGAIGSFVGGLFGGHGEDPHNNADTSSVGFKLSRSGVAGFGTGYYADSTTGFNGYTPFSTTSGNTSGGSRWGDNIALPQATLDAINTAAAQLFTGGASLARGLGLDPHIADSAAVASGTFATVEAALSDLSDAIVSKVIPNIKDFQQANEKLGDTASRLVAEFNLTNLIAKMRGQTGAQTFGSGLAGRDQLVQLLGGTSNASTAIGSYYQNFYTDAERKKNAQGEISATLKSLGINQDITTRDQFRAIVDAQDLTTESGRKMYASLVSIADAFAGITDVATAAAAATKSVANNFSTDLFKTRADYIFAQQTGILPHYAAGGDHDGGWAVVGENGPELANLGPSRVYSNSDSKSLVDFSGLQNEISALRSDLRSGQAAMAHSLKVMEKKVSQWDGNGMPAVRV